MSATGTGSQQFTLTHRQVLIVFSGLLLGMFLAALDQTIVSTALPTIVSDLHGLNHYSWVVTAYLLTSTATTPLYGKISDLYGRKKVFQSAIVIFLIGSALSGLSRNMGQLIAFRAVQGLGAGGLMTLAMTIIADIVSPRDRGRYQGYFGGTFAISSVGGPLLGGLFTQHLSWRWVFYLNLPIGIIALIVTSIVLNLPFTRRQHAVDWLGATLMMGGVSALLLVTVWGGQQTNGGYPWGSPIIIGLALTGVALVTVFFWWERRVSEPILPPYLFRNSIFTTSSGGQFVLGSAMFGAIIFLPLYLQVVKGQSPTVSGLAILPIMAGVLMMSIIVGRTVSRTGRYKIFPVIGTTLLVIGMWLFTHLRTTTSELDISVYMLVVGAGMGMTMQQLVIAVQNAVPVKDLGTATSALTFFRSMGGSFGTSLFGAILVSRLSFWLARNPLTAHVKASQLTAGATKSVRRVPAAVHQAIDGALVHALHAIFLTAVPISAVAVVLALLLKEVKLRDTIGLARDVDALPGGAATEAALAAAQSGGDQ